MYKVGYIGRAVLIVFIFLSACTRSHDDSWDVLLGGVPDQIVPNRSYQRSVNYVFSQTHEPLLRNDKDVSYYSKLLKYWDHNADDTLFSFCLKSDLYFAEGVNFEVDNLKDYFDQLFVRLGNKAVVTVKDDSCVIVSLVQSLPALPNTLSRYDLAPSRPSNNPAYEWGLGPYQIVIFETHQILLKRKIKGTKGFNFIHFFDFEQLQVDKSIDEYSIEDFTRLPPERNPDWVSREYKKYFVKILQSRDLIINIPDEKLRQVVYHCMDIQGLRRAFSVGRYVDIKTILPLGFPGAKQGSPDQDCEIYREQFKDQNIQLTFFDWKGTNTAQFISLFDKFFDQTGIRINIQNGTHAGFLKSIAIVPHPYNLYIAFLNTSNPFLDPVVSSVLGPDIYLVDYKLPDYDSLYDKWSQEIDSNKKNEIAAQMADLITQHAVVLPLTQDVRDFYYPRDIKGLNFSRTTTQNPEVVDLYR